MKKAHGLLLAVLALVLLVPTALIAQWQRLNSGVTEDLKVLKFVNNTTGYVASDVSLSRTTDGGAHWEYVYSSEVQSDPIQSFVFKNALIGYIAWKNVIKKTIDGGTTWSIIHQYLPGMYASENYSDLALDESGEGLYALVTTTVLYSYTGEIIHFSEESNVKSQRIALVNASGENVIGRSLAKMPNGSYRVSAMDAPTIASYGSKKSYLLEVVRMQITRVAAYNGELRAINANGYYALSTWSSIPSAWKRNSMGQGSNTEIETFFYHHDAYGGGNGHPYSQPDSTYGVDYLPNFISSLLNGRMYFIGTYSPDRDNRRSASVKYYNPSTHRIYNDNTYIGTENLYGLAETEDALYACGTHGTILKHTVITHIEEHQGEGMLNKGFKLNNYPNPFNPQTTIAYTTSKAGLVTLTVYDMLGRLVATPVNGIEQAGDHAISFDASSLASGHYTYLLKVGEYTESKKMTIVK